MSVGQHIREYLIATGRSQIWLSKATGHQQERGSLGGGPGVQGSVRAGEVLREVEDRAAVVRANQR